MTIQHKSTEIPNVIFLKFTLCDKSADKHMHHRSATSDSLYKVTPARNYVASSPPGHS